MPLCLGPGLGRRARIAPTQRRATRSLSNQPPTSSSVGTRFTGPRRLWEDELDEPPTVRGARPAPRCEGFSKKQEQYPDSSTLFEHCTPSTRGAVGRVVRRQGIFESPQHMAGARVRCLERSSRILRSGAKHRANKTLNFVSATMTDAVQDHLVEVNAVVALHACGTSPTARNGPEMRLPNIAVSPCCYHAEREKSASAGAHLAKQEVLVCPPVSGLSYCGNRSCPPCPSPQKRARIGISPRSGGMEFLSTGIGIYTSRELSIPFSRKLSQFVAAGSERLGLQPPQASTSIEERQPQEESGLGMSSALAF